MLNMTGKKRRREKNWRPKKKAEKEAERAQLAVQILASPVNKNLPGGV